MNIKLVFAFLSVALLLAYYPYLRDIFQRKTKPHIYTWLVWALTQGTATAALWYGGGNFGAIGLAGGTLMVVVIFLLSFKYGTKDINKTDTIVLVAALLAIIVWWQLHSPFLAVLMVSTIDGLGYIPTLRKSFIEPWSETVSFWVAMAISSLFALLANAEYNFLTVTYLATLAAANLTVTLICLSRRKSVLKPDFSE